MSQIRLDARAHRYIEGVLHAGGSLARVLVGQLRLDVGETELWLPDGADIAGLYDFEAGGKLSIHPTQTLAGGAPVSLVDSTDPWLAAHVAQTLDEGSCNAWIFENRVAEPGDAWLRRLETQPVIFSNSVYHVVFGQGRLREVNVAISDASSALPLIGFGWSFAADPVSRVAVVELVMRAQTRALRQLAIGCYDGEAFLLWRAMPGRV